MTSHALLALLLAAPAAASDLPAPAVDTEFRTAPLERVLLGRDLFFDPILSGNRTTSCASCHHPAHATADAVSLGLGDGATGLGPDRQVDAENLPEQRIPRNAPALWNLGHRSFTVLFHDGRLEEDPARPSGLRTPLEDDMVTGFDSALSAQTMFPVLSPDEMAGHYEENDVARAVRQGLITGPDGAWSILTARVAAIPEYRERFAAAWPEIAGPHDSDGRPLAFTDIANALADFIAVEFRADDSPFDRHLRGEAPLAGPASEGMALFYGRAGCSTCHAGPFQTDHAFHAMAMPQFGPGKAARFERHQRDIGRMRVTGRAEDAYRFRTPTLRMVALTAPYGHSGAYAELRAVVRHMADPAAGLDGYDRAQTLLPALPGAARPDWAILDDPAERAAIRHAASGHVPVALSDAEIDALLAFLHALTDSKAAEGRLGVPATVPSGLPVDQPPAR